MGWKLVLILSGHFNAIGTRTLCVCEHTKTLSHVAHKHKPNARARGCSSGRRISQYSHIRLLLFCNQVVISLSLYRYLRRRLASFICYILLAFCVPFVRTLAAGAVALWWRPTSYTSVAADAAQHSVVCVYNVQTEDGLALTEAHDAALYVTAIAKLLPHTRAQVFPTRITNCTRLGAHRAQRSSLTGHRPGIWKGLGGGAVRVFVIVQSVRKAHMCVVCACGMWKLHHLCLYSTM